MNFKTIIIIPLFNEEENIKFVIDDLNKLDNRFDVLFVNDKSTDNTLSKIKELSIFPVLQLPSNLGVGGAVQSGFKYAVLNDYDFAIQFDGDGQHIAGEISKIMKPLLENNTDVAIGSRFLSPDNKYEGEKKRKIGINYLNFINYILTGIKITDITSGFRAYNKKAILYLSENYPDDYPEPEAIMLFHRRKFRVMEIPVEMRKRQKGKSSIRGLLTFYYIIKVTVAMVISYFQKH